MHIHNPVVCIILAILIFGNIFLDWYKASRRMHTYGLMGERRRAFVQWLISGEIAANGVLLAIITHVPASGHRHPMFAIESICLVLTTLAFLSFASSRQESILEECLTEKRRSRMRDESQSDSVI